MKLTHNPIPYADENILSLFLRASYANGYQTPQQMLSNFKIPIYTMSYNAIPFNVEKCKIIIEKLNITQGISNLVIDKIPQSSRYYYWTATQKLHIPLVNINLNKFCPSCLGSYGYWKKNWSLVPVTTCLEHQIDLINNCPACNTFLDASRNSLFICQKCSFDLRASHPSISTEEEITVNTWFLAKLSLNKDNFNVIFFDIWSALNDYFSALNIKKEQIDILSLCYTYFEDQDYFLEIFMAEIEKNLVFSHPKIQLLPFLKKKKYFTESIINPIIFKYKGYSQYAAKRIDYTLNKNATLLILDTCFRTFKKKLETGFLSHDQLYQCKKNTFSSEIIEDWLVNNDYHTTDRYNSIRSPITTDESKNYFSIYEISNLFGISGAITRAFVRNPNIPRTRKFLINHSKTCVKKQFILDFNDTYIFPSMLANQLSVPVMTIRDKLSFLNINPAPLSEPSTPFYYRKDVQHLTKEILQNINQFPSRAGRRKKGVIVENKNTIDLSSAATALDLSEYQTTHLIRTGLLRAEFDKKPYRIYRKSLNRLLQRKNDPSYISLEDTLKALSLTSRELDKNWVMTGYLSIIKIGYWKFIELKKFQYVQDIHKSFFTASQANAYLRMHRTHITNLVKQGLIKSHIFGHHIYSIRLFKKEDVEQLRINLKGRSKKS